MKIADPGLATEVAGLAPSEPSARPADILTNAAIPGRGAALDVVVASQEACGAGLDCLLTAVRRKVHRYREVIRDLEAAGLLFRPMAFSAEGRLHPMCSRILAHVATQVARRRPGTDKAGILRRWKCEIGTAIARRIARMMRACLPRDNLEVDKILYSSQ